MAARRERPRRQKGEWRSITFSLASHSYRFFFFLPFPLSFYVLLSWSLPLFLLHRYSPTPNKPCLLSICLLPYKSVLFILSLVFTTFHNKNNYFLLFSSFCKSNLEEKRSKGTASLFLTTTLKHRFNLLQYYLARIGLSLSIFISFPPSLSFFTCHCFSLTNAISRNYFISLFFSLYLFLTP